MKYKWTYEVNKSLRQIFIILLGETLSDEIFVGRKAGKERLGVRNMLLIQYVVNLIC